MKNAVVIGAGISGISCALEFEKMNLMYRY